MPLPTLRARLTAMWPALLVTIGTGIFTQTTANKAVVTYVNDEELARLVKEWTAGPEFISPLVDHLPKGAAAAPARPALVAAGN